MLIHELSKNRIEGPFSDPPFKNFEVSPLGLVEKRENNKFRIIHDLSHPNNNSVNHFIDKSYTSVSYETIDNITHFVKKYGKGSLIAKTDIEEAFRLIPVHPSNYHLLGFNFDGSYYFDKCLPMGASISCSLFEKFSTALQWIMQTKFDAKGISHILDDFIFIGPPDSPECLLKLNQFLELCSQINIPIKKSKTFTPSENRLFMVLK